MADNAPAGPVAVAVDALITLISNLSTVQTWTSTTDATGALGRIYDGEVGYPIRSVSIASNVLTVNTREIHKLTPGVSVSLQGPSIGMQGLVLYGTYVVASVTSDAFTVAITAADLDEIEVDQAFVLPGLRPYIVVSEADDALRSTSIGTGGTSIFGGALDILIEAATPLAYTNDPVNALREARNAFGSFIRDLMTTQGNGDYIHLNGCDPTRPPAFVADSEQTQGPDRFGRWQALVRVTWGLES